MFRAGEPLVVDPIAVRSALLFSDTHLSDSKPRLTGHLIGWLSQFNAEGRRPDAMVILGDLFDLWIGDDSQAFAPSGSAAALLTELFDQFSKKGVRIYFLHGNRDFLIRNAFTDKFGGLLIDDPSVMSIESGMTVALTHGDRLCTHDKAYQDFRQMVRSTAWQADFLAKTLSERRTIAGNLREQSDQDKSGKSLEIMDVTPEEAAFLTDRLGADVLIHGHTHRPGVSPMPNGKLRWVLPDWSDDGSRGGGLWADAHGVREISLSVAP